MTLARALERLTADHPFGRDEAAEAMRSLVSVDASSVHVAAFLGLLRARGATSVELAGFVDALRSMQVDITFSGENLVDACGTGGGRPTINLSTGAAFIAAGAGARIAKHGNRSVTSACGSADVLEAMGISLSADPAFLHRTMNESRMAFLFAPAFHPALKAVGAVRKELGFRTVFNQLGPLLNPARAKRQIIGVYDDAMLIPMAEALAMLGAERAFIVRSFDELDEFSPCHSTRVAEVCGGQVEEYIVTSADFGLEPLQSHHIHQPANAVEAGRILTEAMSDVDSAVFRAMVPNAAACLVVAGLAPDWKTGADMAMQAGLDGRVRIGLNAVVELSRLA